jgi:hypothetical protein
MTLLAKDLWEVVDGDKVFKGAKAEEAIVWDKKARKTLALIAFSLFSGSLGHLQQVVSRLRME